MQLCSAFVFNDTATTEIYTLSLHDALPISEWFRRRGAQVVMVPTTQSADLRKYYSKHTKNDRIDSELLARLPLLHPEGLRPYAGQGPADPLRRLVKQRSTLVKRRTAILARLDAL